MVETEIMGFEVGGRDHMPRNVGGHQELKKAGTWILPLRRPERTDLLTLLLLPFRIASDLQRCQRIKMCCFNVIRFVVIYNLAVTMGSYCLGQSESHGHTQIQGWETDSPLDETAVSFGKRYASRDGKNFWSYFAVDHICECVTSSQ